MGGTPSPRGKPETSMRRSTRRRAAPSSAYRSGSRVRRRCLNRAAGLAADAGSVGSDCRVSGVGGRPPVRFPELPEAGKRHRSRTHERGRLRLAPLSEEPGIGGDGSFEGAPARRVRGIAASDGDDPGPCCRCKSSGTKAACFEGVRIAGQVEEQDESGLPFRCRCDLDPLGGNTAGVDAARAHRRHHRFTGR